MHVADPPVDMGFLLGDEGPFAGALEGFSVRGAQQAMARAVDRTLQDQDVLVCEAGTGTGKTLAYLVPVLMSGQKTILSTGTKNLQEQLFGRDIPGAIAALGVSPRVALLKGRANYLCWHRLTLTEQQPPMHPEEQSDLVHIRQWATRSESGEISQCAEIAENAAVWGRVTSTVDNCLGTECQFYDDCHVLKARRLAIEADVVVVNHHLFFADMALREEGFGELLPGARAVVFDEAHQLPDIATRFFGISLSSSQLRELCRDTLAAYRGEAGDVPEFPARVSALEKAAAELRISFGVDVQRVAWLDVADNQAVKTCLEELHVALTEFCDALELMAERGRALDSCYRRSLVAKEKLDALSIPPSGQFIQWLELNRRNFTWHLSPLEVADIFAARMHAQPCAWIFTSATLAVNESLAHFAERLGLEDYRGEIWDSPFDYRHQALCYIPRDLPEPRDPGYLEATVQASLPVLTASRGRAFFLFTSHQALERAARALERCADFPLFVQGSAPRDELLRRFRTTERAVLLGTSSFWEGVDVRGQALCCVIIDKLPFAAPDDPLLQARLRALKEQGRDPFMVYQLPQAVIALKQGCGRLIRDEGDCGVLMLCDPRLLSKAYGRVFLNSLPPAPVTRAVQEVETFLATLTGG